jgi:hypothetical protein
VPGRVALLTATLSAQTGFPKSAYYVGLGDSVAAGTGALPVTHGYVYQLYDRGVFGRKQEMAFANAALRGARSWELRDDQVPQVLCTEPAQRPTVATITAGANDFFRGDFDVSGMAQRVAESVHVLLNNPAVSHPVLDPWTGLPYRPLEHVTMLVSNYYSNAAPGAGRRRETGCRAPWVRSGAPVLDRASAGPGGVASGHRRSLHATQWRSR